MKYGFTIFILAISIASSQAQSEYEFNKGLAIERCHRSGREAIVTDQLAHQLAAGTFKTPTLGAKLFTDSEGKEVLWQNIETDSTGKFRGEALMNGYIYLTYEAARSQEA